MLRSSRSDLRIDMSISKLTKPFYTTLDEIAGRLIFNPQLTVEVDDVLIDFLGFAKTWIDPATPGSARKKGVCQVATNRVAYAYISSSR